MSVDRINVRPTNLGIANCSIPIQFNCTDRIPFKVDTQPNYKCDFVTLNPCIYRPNKEFQHVKTDCPNGKCQDVFLSNDPRLKSAAHGGQVLPLDRPPMDLSVNMDNVYNIDLKNYGEHYSSYADINAGQIEYYYNRSREDAFHRPVFSNQSIMVAELYKDPMGAIKPQYERVCHPNPAVNQTCLSWITDSQEHREDLMARQMRKRNEQEWMPRWSC